ncbi:methylamine utilization protein MauE [Streptomyces spiroverticillatus]|uniref:Methylamine utilization protein MauE n=1 Tax=Streptomyces finlayi TaxID=67296 RepID=A0A918X0N7_9ACTN|nr:MauE/DoxX family redox-associated membrane protein [Streptomyces finlayi]GHA38686.1 methylamine utilization protein MauE [Streptomyces spiroverticillatus]GHD00801.1 methylamine utilization protein MauE [Streptomyces finlayi]
MDYVVLACRVLVAMVFVASAASKLLSAASFRSFVTATRDMAVPAPLAPAVAVGVVAGEIGSVALLVLWPGGVAGFVVAGVLLVAFTAGIAGVLLRGKDQSCNCFGSTTAPIGPRHVVRNVALLTVVAAGLLCQTPWEAEYHWTGVVAASVAGLVGAVLVLSTDNLAELLASGAAEDPEQRPAAQDDRAAGASGGR